MAPNSKELKVYDHQFYELIASVLNYLHRLIFIIIYRNLIINGINLVSFLFIFCGASFRPFLFDQNSSSMVWFVICDFK